MVRGEWGVRGAVLGRNSGKGEGPDREGQVVCATEPLSDPYGN